MRRYLSSLCAAAFICMPLLASFPAPVSAAQTATGLIKGPGDTVYWKSANGKRYVFPTYNTFKSWYGETSPDIQPLTLEELGSITIGGNVTYKPGVRMVKITTDPKVYAIGRYGVLRWITSETVAIQLYGEAWSRMIDDIPDPYFVNYKIGANINTTNDYSPSAETAAVATPDDNIGQPTSQVPTSSPTGSPTNPTAPTSSPVVSGPAAPTITSPTANQILTNYPRTLTVAWANDNQPRHNVEVACDVCVSTVNLYSSPTIYYAGDRMMSYSVPALAGDNTYRVRVQAIDSNNVAGAWSAYTYFSFKTTAVSPTAPTSAPVPAITYPANDQVFTYFPRTVSVSWTSTGAANYRLHVNCASGCWPVVGTDNVDAYLTSEGARTSLPITLTGDNRVGVQVQSINADGSYGAWSNYVYFSFKTAPSGPAAPTITSPTANQVLTNYPRTMTVTWASDSQPRHNVEIEMGWDGQYSGATSYSASDYMMSRSIPALAGDNPFRVRVQAVDVNGVAGAWSAYTYFSFKTSSGPAAPTITSPTANQVFTNYPRTMTVTWANDSQPRHNVEVACDICVSATSPYSSPTTYVAGDRMMSYNVPALAGDNTYRVRVQAVDASGATGPWTDYVYFSFKTVPQTSVYVDYVVWGTSKTGRLVLDPNNCAGLKCGYNFSNNSYAGYGDGAFYTLVQNGVMAFWGNNIGQGGNVKLANGDVAPPSGRSGDYSRFAVPIENGAWYAVYDSANMQYIKLHVTNVVTQ